MYRSATKSGFLDQMTFVQNGIDDVRQFYYMTKCSYFIIPNSTFHYFASLINADNLLGNMLHKNLTLICGNTRSDYVIDLANKLGPYDFIFIDADHTYEGVKSDFNNYLPMLSEGGVIGFHDVECPDWPGINEFWNELESTNKYNMQKFVKKGFILQYGIGMLTLK